MYYPCSENKGADQLRSYCEADLPICFRLSRLLVFPCGGSFHLIFPSIISEAIEAFNLFDKDNDRGLDIDELFAVFKALGQRPPIQELENILETYDVNSK